jgi:hypothetical protein
MKIDTASCGDEQQTKKGAGTAYGNFKEVFEGWSEKGRSQGWREEGRWRLEEGRLEEGRLEEEVV